MSKEINAEKILEFLHEAGKLKTTIRFGANSIIRGDSSADHSWRLALMTFLVAEELDLKIDRYRALKIALVHDLAEAIAGDTDARLVHSKIVSKEEKDRKENEAIKKLSGFLPPRQKKEILGLWREYNDKSSAEAKFITALDKLETQAKIIEEGYKVYDAPDLIATYGNKEVGNFPALLGILKIVKKKIRAEFKKGKIPWKKEYELRKK